VGLLRCIPEIIKLGMGGHDRSYDSTAHPFGQAAPVTVGEGAVTAHPHKTSHVLDMLAASS
jgi:hypothetical protein